MNANETYAFNGAVKKLGINYEREDFYNWCESHKVFDTAKDYTLRGWLNFWDQFLSDGDVQDLQDTQDDAVAVPF